MPTSKLTKESSKALLAMLKHSYFKNVRDHIKQIWARSMNSEQTANEWLVTYHPLIVECEKLAIEPKVCARMCYIKYHKENPYTKHLNKNNDVSLNTLKKEALQYFEGLRKWKEDNKEFNKEIEEFMKNEKVIAAALKPFSIKGTIIEALDKDKAIKAYTCNKIRHKLLEKLKPIVKNLEVTYYEDDHYNYNSWNKKTAKDKLVVSGGGTYDLDKAGKNAIAFTVGWEHGKSSYDCIKKEDMMRYINQNILPVASTFLKKYKGFSKKPLVKYMQGCDMYRVLFMLKDKD